MLTILEGSQEDMSSSATIKNSVQSLLESAGLKEQNESAKRIANNQSWSIDTLTQQYYCKAASSKEIPKILTRAAGILNEELSELHSNGILDHSKTYSLKNVTSIEDLTEKTEPANDSGVLYIVGEVGTRWSGTAQTSSGEKSFTLDDAVGGRAPFFLAMTSIS